MQATERYELSFFVSDPARGVCPEIPSTLSHNDKADDGLQPHSPLEISTRKCSDFPAGVHLPQLQGVVIRSRECISPIRTERD